MNIEKAKNTVWELGKKSVMTPDEEFTYIESLEFLIDETKDTDYMTQLGGYYYGKKIYDLALKYYEMADTYGDKWAAEGLGYIWYYGRTGEVDYEKAFKYYSKAADNGYLQAKIKVADMYKNGYYVDKDYDKYCRIIEHAKKDVENTRELFDPLPEVYTRLARIRKQQGRIEEAVDLYMEVKWFLAQRIRYSQFFGDLNVMKWTVEDLYSMIPFDETDFDLYDLYWLLRTPVKVTFRYKGKKYEIESSQDEGKMAVRFEDKWFRTVDDFFNKAVIDGKLLIVVYRDLYGFGVIH
nr:sel1 repeat family protein [Clostridia bacterium]